MFYEVEIKGHIRLPPSSFEMNTKEAILKRLNEQFENFISKELGFVIAVSEIISVGDGIIIPGDGAAYYETVFRLFIYRPEIKEVVLGKITDITDFGAFIDIGPVDGMIHISQTMDDFVSYNKSDALTGKESKRVLKTKDKCKARIIAISYKTLKEPKIGLTMRQPYLGSLKWLTEEKEKTKKTKK